MPKIIELYGIVGNEHCRTEGGSLAMRNISFRALLGWFLVKQVEGGTQSVLTEA